MKSQVGLLMGLIVCLVIPLRSLGACLTAFDLTQAVTQVTSAAGNPGLGDADFVRKVFQGLFRVKEDAVPASLAGDAKDMYSQLTQATNDWEPFGFPTQSAAQQLVFLKNVQALANLGEFIVAVQKVDASHTNAHVAIVVPAADPPIDPNAQWTNAPQIAQGTVAGVATVSSSGPLSSGFKPSDAARIEFFRYKH